MVTHINGQPSATGRAQDRKSSPIKDRCYKSNDSFDKVECFFAVSGNNLERNFVLSKWKQIEHLQFVSTLSKGRNFVLHCCQKRQQTRMLLRRSRTLLRHSCWCARGLTVCCLAAIDLPRRSCIQLQRSSHSVAVITCLHFGLILSSFISSNQSTSSTSFSTPIGSTSNHKQIPVTKCEV